MPIAELVFEVVDPSLAFERKQQMADAVEKGTVLAEVEGSTHSLLTGERLGAQFNAAAIRHCNEDERICCMRCEGLPVAACRYAQNDAGPPAA